MCVLSVVTGTAAKISVTGADLYLKLTAYSPRMIAIA